VGFHKDTTSYQTSYDIIAVQEHWLANHDLDKVIHFNSEFSGIAHSAMTDKLQQGLLRGHPFGGLAILARKSVIKGMYKYSVDSQNRALAVVVQLVSCANLLTISGVVVLECKGTPFR